MPRFFTENKFEFCGRCFLLIPYPSITRKGIRYYNVVRLCKQNKRFEKIYSYIYSIMYLNNNTIVILRRNIIYRNHIYNIYIHMQILNVYSQKHYFAVNLNILSYTYVCFSFLILENLWFINNIPFQME